MWIVGTHEDRFFSIHQNEKSALEDYDERKKFYSPIGDEIKNIESMVILAKVEKYVRYVNSKEPVIDVDENGEEFERDDENYINYEEKKFSNDEQAVK